MGLFTPAWMTKEIVNKEKALKSVEKITRQDKLLEVALHAPLDAVRTEAVERLTDQNALYEVAETGEWYLYSKAIDKITDQMLLEKLASKHPTPKVVMRLTNQSLLEKIAFEENWKEQYGGSGVYNQNSELQCAAIKNLKSQDLLKKLFMESADNNVRMTAIENISDEAVLRQAAYQDNEPGIRLIAAKKLGLTDVINEVNSILQAERLKQTPGNKNYDKELIEIEGINDKSILIDIYLHARCVGIRWCARDRWISLQPTQQELVQLLLTNQISTPDKEKFISMIRKNGLIELVQKINIRSDDDERTVLLVLDRLKSFRETLFDMYTTSEPNTFIHEETWNLLVKHHRKYLREKGLEEEAERTASSLRASEEKWKKHLNDVSDAIEQHGGI